MKVALTGAATGIGAATAERFKREGATVIGIDINQPQDHVDHWIEADLTTGTGAKTAADKAREFGPFDVLVNCAGLPPREGLEEKILGLNVFGLRALTDALVPSMVDGGTIVNVASRAGAFWRENLDQVKALLALTDETGVPDFLAANPMDATRAYNLSKEAVIVLTMAQTQELLAKGLRVNSVSPAAVSTAILDDFITAFGDKVNKAMEMTGRAGQAGEVADVIYFLASPESRWIKGQDITIDGGISAMVGSQMMGLN